MTIQSVRGMPDILPEQSGGWLFLEQTVAALFSSYGLVQVRTPVVEETRLFARAVGDVTDIVEKEMYSFDDRSGESKWYKHKMVENRGITMEDQFVQKLLRSK